jgi:hypothetical protein
MSSTSYNLSPPGAAAALHELAVFENEALNQFLELAENTALARNMEPRDPRSSRPTTSASSLTAPWRGSEARSPWSSRSTAMPGLQTTALSTRSPQPCRRASKFFTSGTRTGSPSGQSRELRAKVSSSNVQKQQRVLLMRGLAFLRRSTSTVDEATSNRVSHPLDGQKVSFSSHHLDAPKIAHIL